MLYIFYFSLLAFIFWSYYHYGIKYGFNMVAFLGVAFFLWVPIIAAFLPKWCAFISFFLLLILLADNAERERQRIKAIKK